jgi:DNA-binding transcriptional MocR family regulator
MVINSLCDGVFNLRGITMRTSPYLPLTDKQQALQAQQRAFLRRSAAILTHSVDYDQAHAAWLAASARVQKIADDIHKGLRY